MAAFAFSSWIFLEALNTHFALIELVFGFYAFYKILQFNKKELFLFGFFVGILWFYWIGLSFRFVGLAWVVPFIIIAIGLVYGVIFYLLGFVKNYALRSIIMLFYFDMATPFGFEWLKPEIILLNANLGVQKYHLFFFLLSVVLFIYMQNKRLLILAFLPLVLAIDFTPHKPHINSNIKLVQTDYTQEEKWDRKNLQQIINNNFNLIDQAIKDKYKAIILPESVFPIYLNRFTDIINRLKQKSQKIIIIAGGLFWDKNSNQYNSTYYFNKGKMIVANKVHLVPFAETTSFLPKSIGKIINKIFFNAAEDYKTANKPTVFTIGKEKYQNAICYEATVEDMYKDSPKNMIAISNNGWYYPSTMPIVQKNVIQFFSRKYQVVVYHSVNKSRSGVVF